jgi:hypothetical protein
MKAMLIGVGAAALLSQVAGGANVYVMSSGDPVLDEAVRQALVAGGHVVTIGAPYTQFDGTQSLAGYGAVYLQANANWMDGDMPVNGQIEILTWMQAGGGLVTSEWVTWKMAGGAMEILAGAMAVIPQPAYASNPTATYAVVTPDATLNAGLPTTMRFPLTDFVGTERLCIERVGSTVFYNSTEYPSAERGVVGRTYGSIGHVLNFSTTAGIDQVQDANFARLLSNAMWWAAAGSACYANCDASTVPPVLNVNDFVCFQTRFAASDAYANCDGSTMPPVLNVNDFICFLTRFAAGCP